jgi:hypothetical protein
MFGQECKSVPTTVLVARLREKDTLIVELERKLQRRNTTIKVAIF